MNKLVIFNVEGTLIDSVKATVLSWRETYLQFGYEFTVPQLQKFAGTNPVEMIRALLPAEDAARLASSLCQAQRAHFRREHSKDAKPHLVARILLERIKRMDYAVALVAQCAQDQLRHYMRLANVSGFVDTMACLDDVAGEDPLLELVCLALVRSSGVSADETLMIGSTPSDAIAARRAGVTAIGLLSSGFGEQELTDAGCLAVYESLAALLDNCFAYRAGAVSRQEPAYTEWTDREIAAAEALYGGRIREDRD